MAIEGKIYERNTLQVIEQISMNNEQRQNADWPTQSGGQNAAWPPPSGSQNAAWPPQPQSGSIRSLNNQVPQNILLRGLNNTGGVNTQLPNSNNVPSNSNSTAGEEGTSRMRNCLSTGDLATLRKSRTDDNNTNTFPNTALGLSRRNSSMTSDNGHISLRQTSFNVSGDSDSYRDTFDQEPKTRRGTLVDMKNSSMGQAISFKSERFTTEDCGGLRVLDCRLRPPEECEPMSKRRKWKKEWKKLCNKAIKTVDDTPSVNDEDISLDALKQYTITTRHVKKSSAFDKCMHFFRLDRIGFFNGSQDGSQDSLLLMFLEFSFHTTFPKLFLSQLTLFMTMIIIFAGFITLAGKLQPGCIQGGDYDNTPFTDAFSLSWTTFSTVGYGATYPSMGPEYALEGYKSGQCAFIDILTSTEAFVGVLYAGFCGAVIFGKVLRIQSRAQVKFSDAITIRFGDGLKGHDEEGEEADEIEDDHADDIDTQSILSSQSLLSSRNSRCPCPILEFRVVNKNCGKQEGEIIDATLNVVAAFEDLKNTPISSRGGKDVAKSNFVPKIKFRHLDIEVKEHPFFQRVWYAKHVLDASSPLLVPDVKKKIRRIGGYWPTELNNAHGVRKSIKFDQLLVNLSGVSNLSTASVYAQKKYSDIDLVVGYQFVRCMYRDDSGAIKVDLDLISDVHEQSGGGGEPLECGSS